MLQQHESSADPCPCLFQQQSPALLVPVPSYLSSQQHGVFCPLPRLFSAYITKPLKMNVLSVSVLSCVEGVFSLALLFILGFIHRNIFSETPISCLEDNVGSCMEIEKPAAFQLCRAGLCFHCSVTTQSVCLLFQMSVS